MFWSQKYGRCDDFWQRNPDHKGGPGNPCAPIDVNAFRTTNFWSRSAMGGDEFHGNTRRDSTTRIPSIDNTYTLLRLYINYSNIAGEEIPQDK